MAHPLQSSRLPPATTGTACLRLAACRLMRLKIVANTISRTDPHERLDRMPKMTVDSTMENICRVVIIMVNTMGPKVLRPCRR